MTALEELPQKSFWSGKRVLVTGHTGFKGSWLSLWLEQLGAEVHGISLPPEDEKPGVFSACNLPARLRSSRFIDIRNEAAVRSALREISPEIVLHLAAQSLVRRSYQDPLGTLQTNIIGTANILHAAAEGPNLRAFLNVTSDKCYENKGWVWGYRETDELGGSDPYSASKACAEIIGTSFARSFLSSTKAHLASARAGNVIGGGDWAADRIIPDLIRAALRGDELVLRNPQATRPWQFVLEPLRGYLLLAERLAAEGARFSGGWNFGPSQEAHHTVEDVVTTAEKAWGRPVRWSVTTAPQPKEMAYLALDSSKARRELNWIPRLNFPEAVAATIEWYACYRDSPQRLGDFTIMQLRRFAVIE